MENKDAEFRRQARQIAYDLEAEGDTTLAGYLFGLLSGDEAFVPQPEISQSPDCFRMLEPAEGPFCLPDPITRDILGIVRSIETNIGVHRFLFHGGPGAGKTEAARWLAKLTGRTLCLVDFTSVLDSTPEQAGNALSCLFSRINHSYTKTKAIFLFDDIDVLSPDGISEHGLQGTDRATRAFTRTFLRELDELDSQVLLVATTRLCDQPGNDLARHFDAVISFDRYSQDDLMKIAENLLDQYRKPLRTTGPNRRLFRKILRQKSPLPYPGDLKSRIRTAAALSDPENESDFFRRLYSAYLGREPKDPKELKARGFTVREIAALTGSSKSTVDRKLKN